MMNKTKRYSIQIILLLFTIYTTAQAPANIVKGSINTPYTVTENETLVATQSIILSPNTHIKSGSTFLAKISPDEYIPFTLSNENFIFTRKYQRALQSAANISNNSDVIESVTYHDGLGRPIQNVAIKGSPNKNDIITHINYDNIGRQGKEYLPYMDNIGLLSSYRNSSDAETGTNNYYKLNYPQDIDNALPNPFSEKGFDNTPLNRVLLQAAPGKDWALNSGHEIKLDYQTNSSIDEVKFYVVTTALNSEGVYFPAVSSTINYADNQLYKTITKNENWVSGKNNTTEEFKNKEGQVVLKRTYADYGSQTEVKHDTYYIYDTYGNLSYVLPPKAEGAITQPILNDLCYLYKYDTKNRLVEKKLPGKDWEYIVYDKLDRPILTQDANLKALNKWLFTKYDAFSRPAYTGEYVNTAQTTRATVQTLADASSNLFESRQTTALNINNSAVNYSNVAFPNTDINLFTISYYDNYENIDLDGGVSADSYGITPITNAKGLNTCSKVRVLNNFKWITTVFYYDSKGRPIYNYSKNTYLDIISTSKSKLDFAGKVMETTITHQKGAATPVSTIDVFTYDHMGRLLTQKQKINNQAEELITANTYDNLGQLISKGIGGKINQPRLQTIDYSYNIRGWLTGINDGDINNSAITMGTGDLFGFQINYSNPSSGAPLHNGNISQTFWKTQTQNTSLKNYTYSYDALNRLTSAVSQDAGRYNESLSYDKNGNILNLTRKGYTDANATDLGIMDNLVFTYDLGNKLFKVKDSSGSTEGFKDGIDTAQEYTYDANGNMKTDDNKGIAAITYNHFNLPVDVTISGQTIHYDYDASGVKQRKVVSGITTDYANGFQYEKLGSGNSVLKFFPTAEGYVNHNNGIFEYIYQYKDHLGNVRLSYCDADNNGTVINAEIVEENNYYPFGLKHKGYNTVSTSTNPALKYKYNGKELQDELQLNVYDYGARNYDPTLGRWMNIDPLAELSRRFSPYMYCYNNPVRFIDPDGMYSTEEWKKDNGVKDSDLESIFEAPSSEPQTEGTDFNINNNEPPVSLFAATMGDVFNRVVNTRKYKDGDGIFSVWTHGAPGYMADEINGGGITTIEQFEAMMEKMSPNWVNARDKAGAVLFLFACNSGATNESNGINIAEIISKAHPNMRIVAAEGYYVYSKLQNGKYKISGIDAIQDSGDNLGYMVSYYEGKRVSRELYTDVLKRIRK